MEDDEAYCVTGLICRNTDPPPVRRSMSRYVELTQASRLGALVVVKDLLQRSDSPTNDVVRALREAAKGRNLHIVRYLVEQCSADVNATDDWENTILMYAAEKGSTELVKYLIDQDSIDIHATDMYGLSAMMKATQQGHFKVVKLFVEQCSVGVNTTDNHGRTPLMLAAEKGNLEMMHYLAEKCNANVDTTDVYGYSALMKAAEAGNIQVAQYLVEHCGADVTIKSNAGFTAMVYAAGNGNIKLVKYFCEVLNAEVEVKDDCECIHTALVQATRKGSTDVFQYLVERCGADVNAKDENGDSALMIAADKGHLEIVRYLAEECGVYVDERNKYAKTALQQAARSGNTEIVRYLVEKCSAEVSARDKFGRSPLMVAALYECTKVVWCLVEQYRADTTFQDEDGATALILAARVGNLDIVRYLAGRSDVDLNIKDKAGNTALIVAAKNASFEVVEYLAGQLRADVFAKNEKGYTALTWTARNGRIDLVRYLAENFGLESSTTDEDSVENQDTNVDKEVALVKAAKWGHLEVVRYLIEHFRVDVNAKDIHGATALMKAATNDKIEIAKYLTEHLHADANATTKNGCTALMMAAEMGNCDVNAKNADQKTAIRLAADRGHLEIQRILTPYLQPDRRSDKSDNTASTESAVSSSDVLTSCSIPPSEIELIHFCEDGNIGGDFLAKWLDADVVVKLFVSNASHSPFEDEVRLWQQLRHPNVVKMYGACDVGPQLKFFVCEYASKGPLNKQVGSSCGLWKNLHKAALGLVYLHERGIVHDDLRCSNILIGNDGMAKLSNFGFSGLMKSSHSTHGVGSMRWKAPEILEGGPPSYESDVYSFGMCILEAATGEIPWGDTDDSLVRRLKARWTPESSVDTLVEPSCPSGPARELVWRMCSNDPANRAKLASVISELECLAIKERSELSQPDHEPASLIDEYADSNELWMKIQSFMEKCDTDAYCRAFEDIKKNTSKVARLSVPHSIGISF